MCPGGHVIVNEFGLLISRILFFNGQLYDLFGCFFLNCLYLVDPVKKNTKPTFWKELSQILKSSGEKYQKTRNFVIILIVIL